MALVRATLDNDERYSVLVAWDGEEALEVAARERPVLVFLDVTMPKLDGYEVCCRLKSDPDLASTRVVILAHSISESDRERGAEAGVDYYFTKPFSPIALLEKVEEVVESG